VNEADKEFIFWQRDSLAVTLYTRKVAYRKLGSIHTNPSAKWWNPGKPPIDCQYSSAAFYETEIDCFGFLKAIRDEL